ncbi:MAG: hypothetical protein IKQ41_09135 [Clostridia bacterium]|nr:hypothetical protein [Clostridia bacterium]
MEEKNLQKKLERAFPDVPKVFHDRLWETAEALRREDQKMKSRKIMRFALTCLLILSLTGGALAAAKHYGVLNFNSGWDDSHYFTLPGAEDMIRYDLAKARTGELLWTVKEAAYDGRVLRILYAVQYTGASVAWTGGDAYSEYQDLLLSHGVSLQCDGTGEIFVNSRAVNLETVDACFGEAAGEIECWVDCRLEGGGEKMRPEGEIAVSMPFRFRDDAVRGNSDADALAFTMNVGDAAGKYALRLPAPCALDTGAVVEITDLHFSPVTVFIDGIIHLPGERTKDKPEEIEKYWDWVASIPEYAALFDLRLENADGETLGESTGGYTGDQVNEDGSLDLLFRYEGTPSEKYTETNYLRFGDWRVPIKLEYQQ